MGDMGKPAGKPREIDQIRFNALGELFRRINDPEQAILDFALEAGVQVTNSRIGYIYLASEDESELYLHAWSKQVMEQCAVESYPDAYKVCATGLWGEAVRQRKPVITNDYENSPHKRGVPQGHVPVLRHMNLPVFDGDKIVLIAGVGNKPGNYSQEDVQQLSLIMDAMWNILKRKRSEEMLRQTNEDLEKIVEERTTELETINAELHRIIEKQQATETALEKQKDQLQIIMDHVPALIAYVDSDLNYQFANAEYRDLFFPGAKTVSGRHIADLLGDTLYDQVKGRYEIALGGWPQRFELDYMLLGKKHILDAAYIPHQFGDRIEGVFVLLTDITARKEIELELKTYSDRLTLATDAGNIGVWEWDFATDELIWDQRMMEIYQVAGNEFPGVYEAWKNRIHPEDRPKAEKALEEAKKPGGRFEGELRVIWPDGQVRTIKAAALTQKDRTSQTLKMTGVNWDITEQKKMEASLKQISITDSLTGAKNRRFFMDKIGREIVRCKRYGLPLSLLTMDIDYFKRINDTHGHDAGDAVLKACVKECHAALRQTDIFSRIGGEEFAVALIHTDVDHAWGMADRLRSSLENLAVEYMDTIIRFEVSIGISSLAGEKDTLDRMMKRSDSALYRAKTNGRNRVEAL